MNNKCNNCAKFLTCNRNECKKISFVEAGILNKPKLIKTEKEGIARFFYIYTRSRKSNKEMQRLRM